MTQTATMVSLVANTATVPYGGTVTLVATLSSSSATGTVTFQDGANKLATVAVTAGKANFGAILQQAGQHSLMCVYSGDAHDSAATSANITVTVGNAPIAYQGYTAFGDSITQNWAVSRGTVTQTSLTNNVATVTLVNVAFASIPKVGDTIGSITGTTNAGGIFNLSSETPITAVGGGFSGFATYNGESGTVTGTVSFALNHADVPAAAESGYLLGLSYVHHLGNLLHVTANDQGVAGATCADMASPVYATIVSGTAPTLYSNSTGINDVKYLAGLTNVTKAPAQFTNCVEAEDIFLATPSSEIVLANAAASGANGWTQSTLVDPWISSQDLGSGRAPSFEMMSNTNGANFTAAINGTSLAVGYEITPASAGTAAVSVDGGTPVSFTTAPTCLSSSGNMATLVRSGNLVTATGSVGGLVANESVVVQGASDATFNGSFTVVTVASNGATWRQNAPNGSTAAKIGFNSCRMSEPSVFARTFSPQVLLLTGLSAGSHSVSVRVTSPSGVGNEVYVDYIAGNQSNNSVVLPMVASVGVERAESPGAPDSLLSTWNNAVSAMVSSVTSAGWSNILFADVRAQQNAVNGGEIGPYIYAEYGATGTFTAGSTTVSGVSPSLTAVMTPGLPIDDDATFLPVGSTIDTVNSTWFTFMPPSGSAGALQSGSGFFNIFAVGVHPNNQGQILYYTPAIYNVINAKP